MPDPTPAAPAPAAAAPTPPTPTPATPAAAAIPAPAAAPDNKKLANQLYKLLTSETEESGAPKKDPPKPAEPAKAADAPPVSSPDKPIKVRKKEPPVETPPKVPSKADLAPVAPATPPTSAPTRAAEPEFNEADLVEEERAMLDDARAAEKYLGEKYKGQSAKMTTFLRENAKKAEAAEKGDIDQADYEAWYSENAPKISAVDFRQIERSRIREDVNRELEPKLESERHARWAESEAPRLAAKGDEMRREMFRSSYPDEVMKAAEDATKGMADPNSADYKKAIAKVRSDYALEVETTERVVNAANEDIQELRRLTTTNPASKKPLVDLDPEAQVWDGQKWVINPAPKTDRGLQHARLLTLVNEVCDQFKKTGGEGLKKDGKWFVTKAEWADMTPAQRAPFWTFSIDDIIGRATGNVKQWVKNAVQHQIQQNEARGFRRTFAAPVVPAAAAAPSGAGAPPAPRPAPAPGPQSGQGNTIGHRLAAQLVSQPAEN